MNPGFTDISRYLTSWHADWRGDGLALLAGAALTLAFSPFDLYLLAILMPALLLWLWTDQPSHRAAWRGGLFGLGLFGTGISWVYISLHEYGNAPAAFAVLATLALILLMTFYMVIAGYLTARWKPKPGPLLWLLVVPALWGLLEWIRSWLFTGFPWLSLGYSQIDAPLGGIAPYLGVFGVSWAVMLSAGCVLLLIQDERRLLWSCALVFLWVCGWILGKIPWTDPAGEPLRVGLIQGNIAQEKKFRPDQLEQTLGRYVRLSRQLAEHNDVIVWPETAIPVFYQEARPFIEFLTVEARQSDTDYLIGIPSGSWETGIFHNSVIGLGDSQNIYHKHRLLPFGEYLPLRFVFNFFHRLVDIPLADFTPGNPEQTLLRAAGHPVGTSICFEAAFGSEIRLSLPAAHFLVNVSNDAWFGDSLAPHQHLQIARMRALEAQRFMARATNTGITAILDAQGRIIARGKQSKPQIVEGTVQPLSGATPYVRLGDGITVLLLSGMLLAGWLGIRRQYQL